MSNVCQEFVFVWGYLDSTTTQLSRPGLSWLLDDPSVSDAENDQGYSRLRTRPAAELATIGVGRYDDLLCSEKPDHVTQQLTATWPRRGRTPGANTSGLMRVPVPPPLTGPCDDQAPNVLVSTNSWATVTGERTTDEKGATLSCEKISHESRPLS